MKLFNKILECLKTHSGKPLTARKIAKWIFDNYRNECEEKRLKSRNPNQSDNELIQQIINEIGSRLSSINLNDESLKKLSIIKNQSPNQYVWDGIILLPHENPSPPPPPPVPPPEDNLKVQVNSLKKRYDAIHPQLEQAILDNRNESDSRLLLNKIIQDVLGYELSEIRTEQRIEQCFADYVLSLDGKSLLIIEVKSVGTRLLDRYVRQAVLYASTSGIQWAVLTNVGIWRLYRVTFDENSKLKYDLIFCIDLQNGLDDEGAYKLMLLSKVGMISYSGLLEKLCKKIIYSIVKICAV